jgi:hypothetical protein
LGGRGESIGGVVGFMKEVRDELRIHDRKNVI